jgi:hypothetical protein
MRLSSEVIEWLQENGQTVPPDAPDASVRTQSRLIERSIRSILRSHRSPKEPDLHTGCRWNGFWGSEISEAEWARASLEEEDHWPSKYL